MTASSAEESPKAHRLHLLQELRKLKRHPHTHPHDPAELTAGQRISDKVAMTMGSWMFIIVQGTILGLWIIANILFINHAWDPYPFILLNLVLSFQAAFTAPILMMSQNRQSEIDRRKAEGDYMVNVKAEMEIEQLHEKIDILREQEMKELIGIIRDMEKKLAAPGTPS